MRHADTDSLRGVIWGMIGDAWHQQAEAGEPNWTNACACKGSARQKGIARKAMKECYKAYERSLRYWPDNTMVLNNYAYFLSLEERDLERALTMSSRVVALTDNNPTYLDTHCVGALQAGTHGRSQEDSAKGRGARRTEKPRTDGSLR